MCGIAAILRAGSGIGEKDRSGIVSMRDAMTHRGPDDCGTHFDRHAALAHRRLSVIDLSEAGHQPMSTDDGRFTIIYNGELYNDLELRESLAAEGVRFRTASDTETMLHAVSRWGNDAAARLRGMYAFVLWDRETRTAIIARDPLGVKPLYLVESESSLMVASEIQALFEHPGHRPSPDLETVGAYLMTVRPEVGRRTLFRGVTSLDPGAWMIATVRDEMIQRSESRPQQPRHGGEPIRATITSSVRAHLRSDAPMCSLLSGGLDSAIVARTASDCVADLSTYCSGDPTAGGGDADDFRFAREAATAFRTRHTEAPIDRGLFIDRWLEMIQRSGMAISTPNEVAINEVARAMRTDGQVVTLSGEGADELFGGYDQPMAAVLRYSREAGDPAPEPLGVFAMASQQWVDAGTLEQIVLPEVADSLRPLPWLTEWHAKMMRSADIAVGDQEKDPVLRSARIYLRFQQDVNLRNLLRRLDSATMLESVEGRTPFADAIVADAASAIPISAMLKFGPAGEVTRTKRPLRDAFAGEIPASIVERPKRSFPLPFQAWIGDVRGAVMEASWIREIIRAEALDQITERPGELWNLAWPVMNLALWGRRWWG